MQAKECRIKLKTVLDSKRNHIRCPIVNPLNRPVYPVEDRIWIRSSNLDDFKEASETMSILDMILDTNLINTSTHSFLLFVDIRKQDDKIISVEIEGGYDVEWKIEEDDILLLISFDQKKADEDRIYIDELI